MFAAGISASKNENSPISPSPLLTVTIVTLDQNIFTSGVRDSASVWNFDNVFGEESERGKKTQVFGECLVWRGCVNVRYCLFNERDIREREIEI